jgi:aryl-alcohol dehydrogenase-like predicted oxidoreductase
VLILWKFTPKTPQNVNPISVLWERIAKSFPQGIAKFCDRGQKVQEFFSMIRGKVNSLALAYVRTRWFVTSTIIGATTIPQLQENLHSINIELDETILTDIDRIHRSYPNPTA